MNCRHCGTKLENTFVDLGFAPPSNAYLTEEDLKRPELYFPLRIKVCDSCLLVQTEDYTRTAELFTAEYAYFSSVSESWLAHARQFAQEIISEHDLDETSFVIEIASNDGYLLKNFLNAGIPCLGIEPTTNTANVARQSGIDVISEFFGGGLGECLRDKRMTADIVIANNVFAHVPDINDFASGLKLILKPEGILTLEFPHLLKLIEHWQFDTIYHEHFSYLSLHVVSRILRQNDLRVWDVKELTTHGGSLRVYACHNDASHIQTIRVNRLLDQETTYGITKIETYRQFQPCADIIKNNFLDFLIRRKIEGDIVVAYGAAAKGNTLLNYAGVKCDLMSAVFDASESKQGKFLPGSHIPILSPDHLNEMTPDYIVILPWNIADEIESQLRESNPQAELVVAVPRLRIL